MRDSNIGKILGKREVNNQNQVILNDEISIHQSDSQNAFDNHMPVNYIQKLQLYHNLQLIYQSICMSIVIRPIQAALIRDTDFFTKMDPFCKMYLGGQCQQTNVCHNGGQSPTWSSTLTFTNCGDMNLRIQVWDYDSVGNNDLIGIGNLNLAGAMQQGGGNSIWVDLFYNGRNAGRVCLSVEMGMGMGMNMGMGNMGIGMNMMGMGMNQMGMGVNPNMGMGMGIGMGNPNMGMGMGVGFNGNPMNNNGWGPNPNNFGPPNNGWGGW